MNHVLKMSDKKSSHYSFLKSNFTSNDESASTRRIDSTISDESNHGPVLSAEIDYHCVSDDDLTVPPVLEPAVTENSGSMSDTSAGPDQLTDNLTKNLEGSLLLVADRSARRSKTLENAASPKATRPTRSSIDPVFAAKQRRFLTKVHNALKTSDDTSSCDSDLENITEMSLNCNSLPKNDDLLKGDSKIDFSSGNGVKRPLDEDSKSSVVSEMEDDAGDVSNISSMSITPPPKKVKKSSSTVTDDLPLEDEQYCWLCHWDKADLKCVNCPRTYHTRCCVQRCQGSYIVKRDWECPECVSISKAESADTKSKAMKMLTLDQLCHLLKFTVSRMKELPGADVFGSPVDENEFPAYKDYIKNPMDLSLLEKRVDSKLYACTEAFVADASWIVHNCIIFNSISSKLTSLAKNILKTCKQDVSEIENCPDCYQNANTATGNWFIQVCRNPHILIWARLKGFPFWPGKAVRGSSDGNVDVRFFGAHDRAWVPARDCFLYSQENPAGGKNAQKKKSGKHDLQPCLKEVELHIYKLREKFGEFKYAPVRIPFDLEKADEQLKSMLPKYNPTFVFEISQAHNLRRKKASKRSPVNEQKQDISDNQRTAESLNQSPKLETLTVTKRVIDFDETKTQDTNPGINRDSADGTKSSASSPTDDIVKLRLNKKDVRKIGLLDRIHEKLRLRSSPNCEDSDTTQGSETNEDAEPILHNGNTEEDASSTTLTLEDRIKAEIIDNTCTIEKRDSSFSQLELLTHNQPTVKLTKLILNKNKTHSQTDTAVISSSMIEEESEDINQVPETITEKELLTESQQQIIKKKTPLTTVTPGTSNSNRKSFVHEDRLVSDSSSTEPSMTITKITDGVESEIENKEKTQSISDISANLVINVSEPSHENPPVPASRSSNKVSSSPRRQNTAGHRETSTKPVGRKSLGRSWKKLKNNLEDQSQVIAVQDMEVSSNATITSEKSTLQKAIKPISTVFIGRIPISTSKTLSTASSSTAGNLPTSTKSIPIIVPSTVTSSSSLPSISVTPTTSILSAQNFNPATDKVVNSSTSQVYCSAFTPVKSVLSAISPKENSSARPESSIDFLESKASKLTATFMNLMKETLSDVAEMGSLETKVISLQLELEAIRWRHEQEIKELRHNNAVAVAEACATLKFESQHALLEAAAQATADKEAAVAETKRHQWCAFCSKEAIFYCCWNTSYCDYACQQNHWPLHSQSCTQTSRAGQSHLEQTKDTLQINASLQAYSPQATVPQSTAFVTSVPSDQPLSSTVKGLPLGYVLCLPSGVSTLMPANTQQK